MGAKRAWRRAVIAGAVGSALLAMMPSGAGAAPRTWIGGNTVWTDGAGNNANWNPADEPDTLDDAIFNLPNTVNLGSTNSVAALSLSAGAMLNTNGHSLTVNGAVSLNGTGTNFIIGGTASVVSADSVSIAPGGLLSLAGGTLTVIEESGSGQLTIHPGGELSGYGTINVDDVVSTPTTLLTNIGTISASRTPATPGGAPPAGTLLLTGNNANARIDLDGIEAGVVNVRRNQSLVVALPLSDEFNGDMNLFQDSTVNFSINWTLGLNGRIDVNNGFDAGSGTPAGAATVSGAQLRQSLGSTITVVDPDGALKFESPFQMDGGNFVNNGLVEFAGTTTIGAAANFTMPTGTSSLTVGPGVVVTVNQPNFNPDGNGTATNVLTVKAGGLIDLNLGSTADQSLSGAIRLEGGILNVDAHDGTWSIDAPLNATGNTASRLRGSQVTFANAAVTVDALSRLVFEGPVVFGAASTYTGGGAIDFAIGVGSIVSADTTIAVSRLGLHTGDHVINNGVKLTINSPAIDTNQFGRIEVGGNNGTLTVNGPASWNVSGTLATNLQESGVTIINGSSRLVLTAEGSLSVSGDTNIDSAITFAADSQHRIWGGVLNLQGEAKYEGPRIRGEGTFNPSSVLNTVDGLFTTIDVTNFGFDRGPWVINDAFLDVDVVDYDNEAVNRFNGTITNNLGQIDVNTGDAEFVMDGTLNLNNGSWTGEPLDIGNDLGAGSARLNVSSGSISSEVDFNADADVRVAAGTTLTLTNLVTFNTANGTMHASFTGAGGTLAFSGPVFVSEPATLNMAGGTVRFNAASATTIAAGGVLSLAGNVVYDGGSFGGAGVLSPSTTLNTVSRTTTIGVGTIHFDRGPWVVNDGAGLALNVTDYDSEAVNRFNGSTITVNGGSVNINTGDAEFVMDGTLNLNNGADWHGEPLDIGNDAGVLDARLNVGGSPFSQIHTEVDFNSDADVRVAGAILMLMGTVNFSTVNGAQNASFTGDGRLTFAGPVSVHEAVTLNMAGGFVDLVGSVESTGDLINVNAPLVINAEALQDFGFEYENFTRNTLDVNSVSGTGSFTVNLDSPTAEWTLTPFGVINLRNGNTAETLLAGSPANLNGAVNVTGRVATGARVDIGGTVNLASATSEFRLAGGSDTDVNTLNGGTINGAGILGANAGRGLSGFGTINANIDFDGNAILVATGGVLDVNGAIVDVGTLRTVGNDAVLDLGVPLDTAVTASGIELRRGIVRGAALTISPGAASLRGRGAVENAVTNNGTIEAQGEVQLRTLTLAGATTINPGSALSAGSGSTLRITGPMSASGEFSKTGAGTLDVNGPQNYPVAAVLRVATGTVNLNTDAGTASSANLTVIVSAGSLNLNTTQHLKSLSIEAGATARLSDVANDAVVRFSSGSFGGTLDLTDNNLIFVSDNAAAAGAITALVRSGYAGGAWNGNGIATSLGTAGRGLGVARADEVGRAGGTFVGETVVAADVLVMHTLYGDADLDGAVDFDDLARLAQNYNSTGKRWPHGDFNYDGLVNFDDLARMAQNYNSALPQGVPGAPPEFAADLAAALAAVPEPGLSVLALAGAILLTTRRPNSPARMSAAQFPMDNFDPPCHN